MEGEITIIPKKTIIPAYMAFKIHHASKKMIRKIWKKFHKLKKKFHNLKIIYLEILEKVFLNLGKKGS